MMREVLLQLVLLGAFSINSVVHCFAPLSSHHGLSTGTLKLSPSSSSQSCLSGVNYVRTAGTGKCTSRHQMVKEETSLLEKKDQKELKSDDAVSNINSNINSGDTSSNINDNDNDNDNDNNASNSFSYAEFAKQNPFLNNIGIATTKTAAADLIAQTVIAQTPLMEVDIQRSFLFMVFGAVYLGGFQYLYQVQVFKKLFDVDKFTNLSWEEKLQDTDGLKALAAQTALDLTVLSFIYLPTFYIFKAGVFSGSTDPSVWTSSGLESYTTNFAKDEVDLLRVWFPADLVCFSVPLYLRLPVRHVVSFVWTAYLSFARGGH
jgi:hypothetical protein